MLRITTCGHEDGGGAEFLGCRGKFIGVAKVEVLLNLYIKCVDICLVNKFGMTRMFLLGLVSDQTRLDFGSCKIHRDRTFTRPVRSILDQFRSNQKIFLSNNDLYISLQNTNFFIL
ncbi:unnamed protein product, partial [Cuscuta epithymum]